MSNKKIDFCNFDEISESYTNEDRWVFVDDGVCEVIAKYEDLPDVIVDLNNKFGNMDLSVYDYEKGNNELLLSTYGMFLNKCNPNVREDIVDRLISLQQGLKKVKKYKLIDEMDLEEFFNFCSLDPEESWKNMIQTEIEKTKRRNARKNEKGDDFNGR